jgi:hypothetical protein
MCTVVYVPLDSGFFVSSNRDETPLRPTEQPQWHDFDGHRALYARDRQAGGSWVGMRKDKTVVVLLNGAFEKHKHQPPYRMSRGLLVHRLLHSDNPFEEMSQTDLNGVEPFTLVLIAAGNVRAHVWDGQKLFAKDYRVDQPAMWSSATLYDTDTRQIRQQAFDNWYVLLMQQTNPAAALGGGAALRPQCAAPSDSELPTIAPLLPSAAAGRPEYPYPTFLKKLFDGYTDPTNGFLMRRPRVETCSVTEILMAPAPVYIYRDLLTGQSFFYD